MKLKLIVIRSTNIQQLSEFYSLFGLSFEYHKHGNSPYHYSAILNDTVIEIYPLAKSQTVADEHLRLGFELDHFDEIISELKIRNTEFVSEPVQTEFGFMTIVKDPDGRKIEIYKNDKF
ncbi:MAG: Glyoxalase/bleomycin resistance protein/dioxygenase [Bacteroidetes bacterium]|jgi:hypothetical protein|nr:Glyoxalase/bleomycin resistance protein/dioxygenase [Bacteroidota bacterium]